MPLGDDALLQQDGCFIHGVGSGPKRDTAPPHQTYSKQRVKHEYTLAKAGLSDSNSHRLLHVPESKQGIACVGSMTHNPLQIFAHGVKTPTLRLWKGRFLHSVV